MVTSVPKLLKMEANSTPTAPEPMTTSDLGMLVDAEDLDVGQDAVVGLVARQHARVGAGGDQHLLGLAPASLCRPHPSTETVWTPSLAGPVRLPEPLNTVTLFFLMRKSRPLTCLAMICVLAVEDVPSS